MKNVSTHRAHTFTKAKSTLNFGIHPDAKSGSGSGLGIWIIPKFNGDFHVHGYIRGKIVMTIGSVFPKI